MKNKAAQQLGRLGGKVTSEAKAAAVRENGKKGGRPPRSTVVLLWRNSEDTEYGAWRLTTYKGDIIPMSAFMTAAAAREYAASRNWGIRRAYNCDV